MKASVYDIIQSELAIFHDEGLQVFELLSSSISKGEKAEVSFEKIDRCSTQFLNAAIGKLYLLNDPEKIDDLLVIDYTSYTDLKEKVAEVRNNAIHSKDYDLLVENATA